MAPQAVAHRRGGTHRVKKVDQTDSIYDTYNYKELVDTTKERGIYRKDMKKVEMAKALRNYDLEQKRAQRNAVIEREKRHQQEEKALQKQNAERQAAIKARHERRIEKERRRARHEVVSDDTSSDAIAEEKHVSLDAVHDYTHEKIGLALSDEFWDSTSSDSTVRSVNQPIMPDCKLRLFEWPYLHLPALTPPALLPTLSARQLSTYGTILPETLPWKIPYAPLKVITTVTKQKLFLPGQKYPPSVDPDYVPILSLQTRTAARNGVLEGVLRKATIEKATHWAERTQVQGWNARMYFNLPSRNEDKYLAETYNKWNLENRKLLRVKGRGDGDPADRERRHAQRHRNKGKEMVEVYEACQYRPLAVCYIPSYLDFGYNLRGEEQSHVGETRSLEKLFFIRFPGCDMPHYFFWTRVGEWEDPTIPNAGWDPTNVQEEPMSDNQEVRQSNGQPVQEQPHKTWKVLSRRWIRVKKANVIHDGSSTSSDPTEFDDTLTRIEHELYSDGLATTLSKYKTKWAANEKYNAWKTFARALPTLYPSGQMPDAPPVDSPAGAKVAVKLAMIDTLEGGQMPYSPLNGDEAWTRDDDRFWDVVEVDEETGWVEEGALYRRFSDTSRKCYEEYATWLDQVSPSNTPPTPTSLAKTWPIEHVSFEEGEEWENRYLRPKGHETSSTCPFCSTDWETMTSEAKAEHMWSHSDNASDHSRRSVIELSPRFADLSITERRPGYQTRITEDVDFDPGVDGDIDTPITSKASKRTTHKRKPRRRSAQSYALGYLSTHIPSLPPRIIRRLPAYHDDAVWNPRRYSTCGSKHIQSPYLPYVKRYPPDHPHAVRKPRKRSYSTIDNLEFLNSYSYKGKKSFKQGRGKVKLRDLDIANTHEQRELKKRKLIVVHGLEDGSKKWGVMNG